MTPKTKLEIIDPYTSEHPGPYALKCDGAPRCFVHAVVNGKAFITTPVDDRPGIVPIHGICNAREVPVAREFFVNEYDWGLGDINETLDRAKRRLAHGEFIRTIHVREVLPGESA